LHYTPDPRHLAIDVRIIVGIIGDPRFGRSRIDDCNQRYCLALRDC